MDRRWLAAALSVLVAAALTADAQFSARLDPVVLLPVGNSSGVLKDGRELDLYGLGYGLNLTGSVTWDGLLFPSVQLGAEQMPLNGVASGSLTSWQAGLGLSVLTYPIPRLVAAVGGLGGLASTTLSSPGAAVLSGLAPYWKVGLEAGYRFTPSLSLGALASYSQTQGSQRAIYKGVTLGLRLTIGLDALSGSGNTLALAVGAQRDLLPVTYYQSEKQPFATLRLTNNDAAEIRDVQVSFAAGDYTSRWALCATYPLVAHGQTIEVPLTAVFNDRVLGFTEATKLSGAIRIDYQSLDARRSETHAVTVVFQHRNAATWADPRVMAAFVSPQDPVMLEFSKYAAGLIRVRAIQEIDKSLQYGMGVFEGLRLAGVRFSADPARPYTKAITQPTVPAYVQYPSQTLSYLSGDSDALAFAFAEAMESIAVSTAFAAVPEDVIVAFPLETSDAQVKATFSQPLNFIYAGGKAWVPLRMSFIRDGFLRAWQAGAELWRAQSPTPELVLVEDAWKTYPAISLPPQEVKIVKPTEEGLTTAFQAVVSRFAQAEVDPKVQRIRSAANGELTGSQHNSIGIAYAQYGFYSQAREEFEKARALGVASAVTNLANVAFLLKDYSSAAALYDQAYAASPTNKNVLLSLARARYELGDYAVVDTLYARLKALDPALADRYSYLAAQLAPGPP